MDEQEEKELLQARLNHLHMLIGAAKKRGDRSEMMRLEVELEIAKSELEALN